MPGWVKRVVNPKVLIPVVIVVGAVAILFGFGNPKKIIGEMTSFNRTDLIWIFMLSVLYEAVRFTQWLFLLHEQGVKAPLRAQIFSFAGGEATRFIPVGNYFQNYLLTTAEGTDFAYTSAATTLIILYEVVISLVGLVILGLGGLQWLTPTIVIGAFLAGFGGWYLYENHGSGNPPRWVQRHERAHKFWDNAHRQLASFGKGAARLVHAKTVAVSLGLATVYLVAAAAILYVSLGGVGWTKTPFLAVVSVYFFSLAIGLILPLPVDIGVTELSGVGAFLAIGVDRNAAISAMLINRLLTVGFSLIIFLVVAIIMWDESKRAWHARGVKRERQQGESDTSETHSNARPRQSRETDRSDAGEDQPRHHEDLTRSARNAAGSTNDADAGTSGTNEHEDAPSHAATAW